MSPARCHCCVGCTPDLQWQLGVHFLTLLSLQPGPQGPEEVLQGQSLYPQAQPSPQESGSHLMDEASLFPTHEMGETLF